MTSDTTILLYSKYSPSSQSIIPLAKSIPNIEMLCVDNETVRKLIINDKKLNISTVPCILLFTSKGVVEKYESGNAFLWVKEVISRISTFNKEIIPYQSQSFPTKVTPLEQPISNNIVQEIVQGIVQEPMLQPQILEEQINNDNNEINELVNQSVKVNSSTMSLAEKMSKERDQIESAIKQQKPTMNIPVHEAPAISIRKR